MPKVDVHADADAADAWTTVATPNKTSNLLDLANGVREDLALVKLADGLYTQMRLIIGTNPDSGLNILNRTHPYANYVIDLSDAAHELKVPSGLQTGIKLVQGFEINANSTTELNLDFDAFSTPDRPSQEIAVTVATDAHTAASVTFQ